MFISSAFFVSYAQARLEGERGESFPRPRDIWGGGRRRSKILKMVFQAASF